MPSVARAAAAPSSATRGGRLPLHLHRLPAQAQERLLHWASRGALDIDGMGEEIVSRLVESGRLSDVADYYTLDEVELSLLDMGRVNKDGEPIRLGSTVAKKTRGRYCGLEGEAVRVRVLFGLGIRHIGKTTAEAVAAAYPSMEALSPADEEALAGIDGIGPENRPQPVGVFAYARQRRGHRALAFGGRVHGAGR